MKAGLSTGSTCTLATRRSGGKHQEAWTAMVQCKAGDPPGWRPALSRWHLICNGREVQRTGTRSFIVFALLWLFWNFFFTTTGSFQVLSTTCPYKRQLWILYALERLRLTEELGRNAASRCWTKCYFLQFRKRKETFSPPFFLAAEPFRPFWMCFIKTAFTLNYENSHNYVPVKFHILKVQLLLL